MSKKIQQRTQFKKMTEPERKRNNWRRGIDNIVKQVAAQDMRVRPLVYSDKRLAEVMTGRCAPEGYVVKHFRTMLPKILRDLADHGIHGAPVNQFGLKLKQLPEIQGEAAAVLPGGRGNKTRGLLLTGKVDGILTVLWASYQVNSGVGKIQKQAERLNPVKHKFTDDAKRMAEEAVTMPVWKLLWPERSLERLREQESLALPGEKR